MNQDPFKSMYGISDTVVSMADEAMTTVSSVFSKIEEVREYNQLRVLQAFRNARFAEAHLGATTGYGYDDIGREKIEQMYAEIFGAEAAYVRIQVTCGTQILVACLFGILKPGEEMLAVTGRPYDTLASALGVEKKEEEFTGSLLDYGMKYNEVQLLPDGSPDLEAIKAAVKPETKVVFLQKSKGYTSRRCLRAEDIKAVVDLVKGIREDIIVFVDNCYGEFVEKQEPCALGADLCAGSLIKNAGGGICPSGAYVAGRKELVERVAERVTAPGLGSHVGPSLGFNRQIAQGLFMAPHVVAEAMKGAVFAAKLLEMAGCRCEPASDDLRGDIVQSVAFPDEQQMVNFCRKVQSCSPVDSFVSPEPWDMPGYDAQVVMAAGAFVQGASIELSADGPIKPPYLVYMQGGLVFEQVKLAVMMAVSEMMEKN
ncbi:MAG: methionine gamma-lyase family protein [Clostridiales bacterium]|nr:methionine gamma-lyase family protein [Clostridiales bacterium]MBR4819989.1 methionine gamma-lyase family protein [Clostridiales bacterium]MBR5058366.1 methionine gamma-lyase family protein [Clostridiales bacterium]